MDLLTNLDPFAVAATALVAILAACVAILVLMRDRESAPPRLISWQVWCAERGQRAVVDFVERVQTGLRMREVRQCSLLQPGERCSEECADLPAPIAEVLPDPAEADADKLHLAS